MNCARVSFTIRGDERQDVAGGDGLIGVEQVGGRGGSAQAPAPRELMAVHVIEAVADVKLIALAEAMIDFREARCCCAPDSDKFAVEISGPGYPIASRCASIDATFAGVMVARPD